MMRTKGDGGSIFYLSEFLGDSLIKAAINRMAYRVHTGEAVPGINI